MDQAPLLESRMPARTSDCACMTYPHVNGHTCAMQHPINDHESAGRLRDQLGHTPAEVAGGAAVGVLLGFLVQGLIFSLLLKNGKAVVA